MINRYAEIKEGLVENVILCNDSTISELNGDYVKILESHGSVAYGWFYDKDNNRFKPTQPYPSWTFDEVEYIWKAPSEKPDTGNWLWKESDLNWFEVIAVPAE